MLSKCLGTISKCKLEQWRMQKVEDEEEARREQHGVGTPWQRGFISFFEVSKDFLTTLKDVLMNKMS